MAIPDEEAALGFLIDAARLMEEEEAADLLQPGEDKEITAEGMRFQLRPPQSRSSLAQTTKEDAKQRRKALRGLMEDVRRQLAEQQALNQTPGENSERARQQQSLAQDARSAASTASDIPESSSSRGDPQAAAEELERAAGLQDETAEALARCSFRKFTNSYG